MRFTERKAFVWCDLHKEADGCTITFIPSGFVGAWLKVTECDDYAVAVEYASEDENALLTETERAAKKHD